MRNKQESRERKGGWGLIAAIFKSIDKELFKVDQISLRDPLSKLLSEYTRKNNNILKNQRILNYMYYLKKLHN